MAELHVLRVFCDAEWGFGNPLGVFLDGEEIPAERRQDVAAELGFSETVFVDDAASGRMRIFTPGLELGLRRAPERRHRLAARQGARAGRGPAPAGGRGRGAGRRRPHLRRRPARVGPGLEVLPARGRAGGRGGRRAARGRGTRLHLGLGRRRRGHGPLALLLARGRGRRGRGDRLGGDLPGGALERDIEILQGRGSRLDARYLGEGRAEVGGRVVLDEVREFELAPAGARRSRAEPSRSCVRRRQFACSSAAGSVTGRLQVKPSQT